MASYSFQTLDRNEKAQCKINENAKQQINHEQEVCLRNSAYQPNQPRMFSHAYQYYQQAAPGSDDQCARKFQPTIRQTVFNIVNTVMKPLEWNTRSRERLSHRVSDAVMNSAQTFFGKVKDVQELSEKLYQQVCREVKRLKIHSMGVEALCEATKQLQYQAFKLYLNPIAESSQCLEPSKQDFNEQEVAKEIQFAYQDESAHDQSQIPWIPAHKLPLTCNQKLEETLSKTISKYSFFLLMLEPTMPETERMNIVNSVEKAVRQVRIHVNYCFVSVILNF